MAVKYEQLVLQPRTTLKKVLAFLGQPWHEAVLHHEDTIGQPGGPSLSRCVGPHQNGIQREDR